MGQIDGSACRCGRIVVPARARCPDCRRLMTGAKLDGKGFVETQTTIHVAPEGFEGPLFLSIVRIAEGARGKPPVRVLARTKEARSMGDWVTLAPEGDLVWAEPT